MICDLFDIVIVPFPFTDRKTQKRRPALIISQSNFNDHGHSILAMITTQTHTPWPGDTAIRNPEETGLKVPCLVRLKIFTLDNRLFIRKIGVLSADDREGFSRNHGRFLVQGTP